MPFENWSSNLKNPAPILYPTSDQDLRELLHQAERLSQIVRVVGSAHSQSPAVCDNAERDCMLVSLRDYHAEPEDITIRHDLREVTVNAGWTIASLYDHLSPHRYFLDTQTTSSVFTIGGIVSMPVHGARLGAGFIADGLRALKVMRSDGSIWQLDNRDANFDVWRLSLGAMGIVLTATFSLNYYPSVAHETRCVDNVFMSGRVQTELLAEIYESVWSDASNSADNDVVRYHHTFLDLHNNRILALDWRPKPTRSWQLDLPEAQTISTVHIPGPRQHPLMLRLMGLITTGVIVAGVKINSSLDQDMFWLSIAEKLRFMSYFIPLPTIGAFYQALEVIRHVADTSPDFVIDYPVDVRFVTKSRAVASPIGQSDSRVYVAIEIACSTDIEGWHDFFQRVEQGWRRLGGKPHYAKLFGLAGADTSFDAEAVAACLTPEAKQRLRPLVEARFMNRFVRDLLR